MNSQRRLGLSYTRFSIPSQSEGDSESRQEEMFKSFCERHNLTPLRDVFRDRGRSGYKDEHRKKGELGRLIAEAKNDRFDRGTVIVVEAWDRLGRLRPDKQTALVAELLQTGVDIGICRLDDVFAESDFGTHKWTTLAVFIQLAYQESKQKAERLSHSWKTRRDKARASGRIMTGRVPGWLELVNGQIREIPERVATVRRIFDLAVAGYGRARIIRQLVADGTPIFGKRPWSMSYVAKILSDRRVLGELQPRRTDDTPDGSILMAYYPAVIDADTFALTGSGRAARRGEKRRERDRKHVNVFQSMLVDARSGGYFHLKNRGARADRETSLVLINSSGSAGRTKTTTFPYDVFETAILGQLKEVKAADVFPKDKAAPNKLEALRAKLKNVQHDVEQMKASLRKGYSQALDDVLREREKEEGEIAREFLDEKAKSVRPPERALEDLPSLVDLIREKGDEARLKIRPVLRSILDEGLLLLVRRDSWILAAVQLHFIGGAVRHYFIVYQTARRLRPRRWWCPPSLIDAVANPADRDLRRPEDAGKLEALLAGVNLKTLLAAMPPL